MEILDIRDIDFSKLIILNYIRSSESTLYCDDELFYKLYDNLLTASRKTKKLLLLNDGEIVPDAVIPNILIKNKCINYGCAMNNIKNSSGLIKYKNSDKFIFLVNNVSISLEKIHSDPRRIVVGDLHFNNILVDTNGKHYFVDFDSCMVDGIPQDRLPKNFMNYVYNRGNFKFKVGSDTDKLCMFLSVLGALFGKDIDDLTMNEYDERAEKLTTLRNMRNYVMEIKNNSNTIPEVPYLHELISINDFPGRKVKIRNNYN